MKKRKHKARNKEQAEPPEQRTKSYELSVCRASAVLADVWRMPASGSSHGVYHDDSSVTMGWETRKRETEENKQTKRKRTMTMTKKNKNKNTNTNDKTYNKPNLCM